MSIRKDPRSPYWQYDFQIRKRRFHGSTGCSSKRDAERFVANLRRQIATGDADKQQITIDQACELYWQDKGQHEKSRSTTEYQLANLCSILGAQRMVGEITLKDFRTYIAKRRGQGVRAASINREWQLARRVWKHARGSGFYVPGSDDPAAIKWSDLLLAEPKERVRELTPTEESRLFDKLDPDLAAVVEFAMLSGQRKSAVIGLLRERVDLEGKRASVHTKGDIWHTFPLTDRMVQIIKGRPEVEGCPFVFTYECKRPAPSRGDRPRRFKGRRYPFSKQGWDRQWRKAKKDAGITDFRFHDLRHTRATRVMRATGNLKAVQKLLGHTDISTTARYAHLVEDDLRNAMAAGELRNSPGAPLQGQEDSDIESASNGVVE
jgi:integrase